MSDSIKFLKTRDVKSPSRANKWDAGIDFYVPKFTKEFLEILDEKNPDINIFDQFNDSDFNIVLEPGQRILIPSGIHCQMSNSNRALIAFNKSGVASRLGLIVGSCVVDYEYQGEIHLSLINTGNSPVEIMSGMKILQFIETPVFNSDILVEENKTPEEFYKEETTRGAGGFGSSDKGPEKVNLNKYRSNSD